MPEREGNPLNYAPETRPSSGIVVQHHEDGGVTVHIPKPPRHGWRMELLLWTPGIVLACIALWLGGVRWRGVRALIDGALSLAQFHPLAVLTLVVPLIVLLMMLAAQIRKTNEPDTVGISPRTVYVSIDGLLARTTFEVPRVKLKGIVMPRAQRCPSIPAFVELRIDGRQDVLFATKRKPAEIISVYRALRRAMRKTTPGR